MNKSHFFLPWNRTINQVSRRGREKREGEIIVFDKHASGPHPPAAAACRFNKHRKKNVTEKFLGNKKNVTDSLYGDFP